MNVAVAYLNAVNLAVYIEQVDINLGTILAY